jgi:hypothetical protein
MISRLIDRCFEQFVTWETCADILAALPDNF